MAQFTARHARELEKQLVERERSRREALEAERARSIAAAEVTATRLRDELGARRVWLIGSAEAPWFHETSDLDLVVEGLSEREAALADAIATKAVGRRVDLLRYETLSASFRESVVREGRLLA